MKKNKEKKKVPRKKKRGESPLTIIFSKKMPVRLVPCWRKLVACAPYGRALSSLLYKHEQNARASGGRKPKIACVASHLHTLITLKRKKLSGATRL